MPRPKLYADTQQRNRVWARARYLSTHPEAMETRVQSQADAQHVVALLAKYGIAAIAEARKDADGAAVWVVRKERKESE